MKKAIIILLALLTVSSLSAKESIMHNQLGGSASTFSGVGISYKYIFNNIWAAKTTVFIYYNSDGNNNSNHRDNTDLFGIIGGEVQYYVHHSKHTGLYLLFGFSEWYEENTNNIYDYNLNQYTTDLSKDFRRMFNIGPGFGLDLIIWDNIVLNFDVGFVYSIENNDYSGSSYYYDNSNSNNQNSFTYGGGVGLSYRF